MKNNYIPHKTTTCNDQDPPRMNKDIKQLILNENKVYKYYLWNNKFPQFLNHFQFLTTMLKSLIEESKEKCYVCLSNGIIDP